MSIGWTGTWTGGCADDYLNGEVVVQLFRNLDGGNQVATVIELNGNPGATVYKSLDPVEGLEMPREACLRIPHSVALALLDVLSRHMGGTSDTRTLRQDYMAERARVDRLIGLQETVLAKATF